MNDHSPDEFHLDFVVLQVSSKATDTFDVYIPELTDRVEHLIDRPAFIVSHPHGYPKQLSSGGYQIIQHNRHYFTHDIQTCRGSSGAPLFHLPMPHVTDGCYPFALHFGREDDGDRGLAIRFSSIMEVIQTALLLQI